MKKMMLAVLFVSAVAFAAAPAAAPAPAAPAKDAKAAPAAAPAKDMVAAADCDMHKAEAQMMKDVSSSKAKVEMVKLDNGTTTIITTDAKSGPVVEKSMMGMDGHMKDAMEGKAKLCEACQHKLEAMKSGKVLGGKGHQGNVWTMSMLSADAETVKMMHTELDAKVASATPAKK